MTVGARKHTAVAAVAIAAVGLTVSAVGCDKDEESDAPAPAATAAPAPPPDTAAAAPADNVASYPEQTRLSGTVRLLRNFQVFQAADTGSKQLTSVGVGTLVDLKAQYKNWVLIDYPSGPGQLSPGWINVTATSRLVQKVERPDGGLPVPDAGTAPVDAGATETPDAGAAETPDAGATETPDAGAAETPDAGAAVPADAGRPKMPFKFKLPKLKSRTN